jgi:hypothetical protein
MMMLSLQNCWWMEILNDDVPGLESMSENEIWIELFQFLEFIEERHWCTAWKIAESVFPILAELRGANKQENLTLNVS